MRPAPSPIAETLPHPLPEAPEARLTLFAIRRMGAFGLGDAQTATVFVNAFGQAFRRPLVLMRTFMGEIAATASGPIAIAPCCCMRMTQAEHALLTILARAERHPESARLLLADLLGVRRVDAVLATAATVAGAFADIGHPLAEA
jgi:hypothetical protein